MLDQSLLKSNFLGRDGFRWWIGQIPPESAHGAQINGGGWGNRLKVRILGYHPYSEVELPNEDLPWAQVLIPTTSGSGAANYATDVKLRSGDIVFGFFLDGDNAQIPVIMATFGRTSQVPSKDYTIPFQPFTGYTSKIQPPNGTLKPNQSSEQNAGAQPSPVHLPPKTAAGIGTDGEISYYSGIGDTIQLAQDIPQSIINKISTQIDNFINFLQNTQAMIAGATEYLERYINSEIDKITEKIQSIVTGLVNGAINGLFEKLIPILNDGLKLLYDLVYQTLLPTLGPAGAHLAGVAAQTAMIGPVKKLQDLIPCVANAIIGMLGDIIRDILKSLVSNVLNFVTCVSDQVIGALFNTIIGQISSMLESAMQGISPITQFFGGFSTENTLRSSPEGLGGIISALNCNQKAPNSQEPVNQWEIGKGPKNVPGISFSDILNAANTAVKIAQIPKVTPISLDNPNLKTNYVGTVISTQKIGINSTTIYLENLNNITNSSLLTTDKEIIKINSLDQNFKSVSVTRAYSGTAQEYPTEQKFSIITNLPEESLTQTNQPSTLEQMIGSWGILSGDVKFPNINSMVNDCYAGPPIQCNSPIISIFGSNGSGASAVPIFGSIIQDGLERTGSIIGAKILSSGSGYNFPPFVEIKDNCGRGYGAVARSVLNSKGELEYIYMISEGENYVVGDENLQEYIIENVHVLNPGSNYTDNDIVTDNFGNTYKPTIFNGSIVSVQPINTSTVTDLPVIIIKSETGSGALLKPILNTRASEAPKEIKQVIDCIS